MITTPHKPAQFYKRWSLTSTIKDGWRPGDITVSATYEEGHEPTKEQLRALADDAIDEAQEVCDRRNADRDQSTRFTSTGKG